MYVCLKLKKYILTCFEAMPLLRTKDNLKFNRESTYMFWGNASFDNQRQFKIKEKINIYIKENKTVFNIYTCFGAIRFLREKDSFKLKRKHTYTFWGITSFKKKWHFEVKEKINLYFLRQ